MFIFSSLTKEKLDETRWSYQYFYLKSFVHTRHWYSPKKHVKYRSRSPLCHTVTELLLMLIRIRRRFFKTPGHLSKKSHSKCKSTAFTQQRGWKKTLIRNSDSPRVFISRVPPPCDLVIVAVLLGWEPSISLTELGVPNHSLCLQPFLVFPQTFLFRFCQDTLIALYVLFQTDGQGGSLLSYIVTIVSLILPARLLNR